MRQFTILVLLKAVKLMAVFYSHFKLYDTDIVGIVGIMLLHWYI